MPRGLPPRAVTPRVVPALVLATAAGAAAEAQPLVEIARQERLRREAIARRAGPDAQPRVYTDADLIHHGLLTMRVDAAAPDTAAGAGTDPDPEAAARPADETAVDETAAGTAADVDEAAAGTAAGEAAADEQRWRDRMAAARQALEAAERRAAQLQTRADGLWADFTGRDDPAQRAVIEQDRQAALAELEETRAEIDERTRTVAEIRDEARRAGVPPGWLR